jgi:soluble lytic murein transglycosylase-like protein
MMGLASAAFWSGQAASMPPIEPPPVVAVLSEVVEIPEEPPEIAEIEPNRAHRVQTVRRHLQRFAKRSGLTPLELDALADVVVDESQRHQLAPELILAVMHVESGYQNYVVSEKEAMGLMQILPTTGRWLAPQIGLTWHGPQTLFDPIANVRLGVAYLRQLWDHYDGNVSAALAAYNWGPGHIDRRIASGVPLPAEYPQLVLAVLNRNTRRS